MRTEFEFILPKGYIDESGTVHKRGIMRLATARDELQPLRDPTISGPDDPRLTIVVLARVVRTLGDMILVTAHEIEGLFAADLAYLQDFYGVINFGTDEDVDAMLEAQKEAARPATARAPEPVAESGSPASDVAAGAAGSTPHGLGSLSEERPGRRAAIQEVPSSGR